MDDTQNNTNITAQIPDDVKAFLESLLMDAGMTALDEKGRDDMVAELYQRLDNFLASVIIEKMPPEHLESFIQLNEKGASQEDTEKFIRDNIPDAENMFADAFSEFRDLYLGNVAVVDHAPTAPDASATPPPPPPAPVDDGQKGVN